MLTKYIEAAMRHAHYEILAIPPVVFWATFSQRASDSYLLWPFYSSIRLILSAHIIVTVRSHFTLRGSRYLPTLWGVAALYVVFAIALWHFNVLWRLKYGARDILWRVFCD